MNPEDTEKPEVSKTIRRVLRIALSAVVWTLFMLTTILVAYVLAWVLLTLVMTGSDFLLERIETLIPLLVGLGVIGALAFLISRFVTSARTVGLIMGSTFALMFFAWTTWALLQPKDAFFLARQLASGESGIRDYLLFPERPVSNAPPVFNFGKDLAPELFKTVEYKSGGETRQMDFEEFLKETQTTSFIVIKDDTILYEGFFTGYDRDSIVTSFSMAKSFTSTLIGIAIDEGYINSVNDPVIDYIPELRGKGYDELTIRDVLKMSTGISYVTDDEESALANFFQFTDSGLSYYYPDLRNQVFELEPSSEPPGAGFRYNDYHPQVLGVIIERTTGRSPSEYLQEKIWKPLGMEYPASWSLDSEESGFELMTAGINGRAIDFAKFGRLFLDGGNWNGKQIVSQQWVTEATSPDPSDNRPWYAYQDWNESGGYYKYMWWGKPDGANSYHYFAVGHDGQRIAVFPQQNIIIVRFGFTDEGVDEWNDVLENVASKIP